MSEIFAFKEKIIFRPLAPWGERTKWSYVKLRAISAYVAVTVAVADEAELSNSLNCQCLSWQCLSKKSAREV